jgi:uncharacterized protein DUF1877
MACREVLFALTAEEERQLLDASQDDEAMMAVIEEIEESWNEEWLQETDKAWDAIHRCLTDGTLNYGSSALHGCILGDVPDSLYEEEDYIVSYKEPDKVKKIAAAIRSIDEAWMRPKYFAINPRDYDVPLSEQDFDYTWDWFQGVQKFYQKGATDGRAVVFTVDQ